VIARQARFANSDHFQTVISELPECLPVTAVEIALIRALLKVEIDQILHPNTEEEAQ